MFVHGGSYSGGRMEKKAEVLDPLASTVEWRTLSDLGTSSIRTRDRQGLFRSDNHAWLFGWSNSTGALRVNL